MPKNIVLLSDGTGNSAAKQHKTNVWRLYQGLDLRHDDQIAFYDDGVGSQEFLPVKLVCGAFGLGLKRNVVPLAWLKRRAYVVTQTRAAAAWSRLKGRGHAPPPKSASRLRGLMGRVPRLRAVVNWLPALALFSVLLLVLRQRGPASPTRRGSFARSASLTDA